MKKRIFSLILALCMVVSLLPMSVFAEGEEAQATFTYYIDSNNGLDYVPTTVTEGGEARYYKTVDGLVSQFTPEAGKENEYNIKFVWPANGTPTIYLKNAVINRTVNGYGFEIGAAGDTLDYKVVIESESSVATSGAGRGPVAVLTNGEVTFTSENNAKLTLTANGAANVINATNQGTELVFENANVAIATTNNMYVGILLKGNLTVDGGKVAITGVGASIWLSDIGPVSGNYTNGSGVARNITVKNGARLNAVVTGYGKPAVAYDGAFTVENANIIISGPNNNPVLPNATITVREEANHTIKTTATLRQVEHNHVAGDPVLESTSDAACKRYCDEVVYCAVCGKNQEMSRTSTLIDPAPSVDHTWGEESTKVNVVASSATTDGSYDVQKTCTVCGESDITDHVTIPRAQFFFNTKWKSNGTLQSYIWLESHSNYVLYEGCTPVYFKTVVGALAQDAEASYAVQCGENDLWNIKVEYPVDGIPTMTLRGANITGFDGITIGGAVYGKETIANFDVNIVVEGDKESTIAPTATGGVAIRSLTNGTVTITGSQKLILNNTNSTGDANVPTLDAKGNVVFKDVEAEITNNSARTYADANNRGIKISQGSLTVDGGKLTVTAAAKSAIDVVAGNIDLKNDADVTVTTNTPYAAVVFGGEMTIDKANLEVIRRTGSNALSKAPTLIGSEVTSGGPTTANTTSYIVKKILPKATITIDGAAVTVTMGSEQYLYDNTVKVEHPTEGNVKITLDGAALSVTNGISISNTIANAEIVVAGASSITTTNAPAIDANNTGTLTITGDALLELSNSSVATIRSYSDLVFQNANVEIEATGDYGHAIQVTHGDLTVDGGVVTAEAAKKQVIMLNNNSASVGGADTSGVIKNIELKNDAQLNVNIVQSYAVAIDFNGQMTINNANLTVTREVWGGKALAKAPILIGSEVTSGRHDGDTRDSYIVKKPLPKATITIDGAAVTVTMGSEQYLYDNTVKVEHPTEGNVKITLDGAALSVTNGISIGNTIANAEIVVAGASSITTTNSPAIEANNTGTLTITGDALLELSSSSVATIRSYSDLVFQNANVEIEATGDYGHAIQVTHGDLTVDGGVVTASAAKKQVIMLNNNGANIGGADSSGVIKNIELKNDAQLNVNIVQSYNVAIEFNGEMTINNAALQVTREVWGGKALSKAPSLIGVEVTSGRHDGDTRDPYIVKKPLPKAFFRVDDTELILSAGQVQELYDGALKLEYPVDGVPTMTLNGLNLTTAKGITIGNADYKDFDVKIVVAGESASTIANTNENYPAIDIAIDGTTTITGTQMLNLAGAGYAKIRAVKDVVFENADVEITSTGSLKQGIFITEGNLTVDGGSVNVTGEAPAIWLAEKLLVHAGEVVLNRDIKQNITIKNDAVLTVSGTVNARAAIGFNGTFTINNANLNVTRAAAGPCLTSEPTFIGEHVVTGRPCADDNIPYIVKKALPKATIVIYDAAGNPINKELSAGATRYFDVVDGVIVDSADDVYNIKFVYPEGGVPTIYLNGAVINHPSKAGLEIGVSGDAYDYNVVVESASSIETLGTYYNSLNISTTGKVTFSGAQLTLKATTTNRALYANAGGDVEFKNANVIIDNGGSEPVTIAGNLIIDGGSVAITSAVQNLIVNKDITLKNDATLTATGNAMGGASIQFGGTFTIDKAKLEVHRESAGKALSSAPVFVDGEGNYTITGKPDGDTRASYIVKPIKGPKAKIVFNTKVSGSELFKDPVYKETHTVYTLVSGTAYYFKTEVGAVAGNPEASYVVECTANDNWNIKLEYPEDGSTPTMTLRGAKITSPDGIYIGDPQADAAYNSFSLNIVVEGDDNEIKTSDSRGTAIKSVTNGTLTISGTGKLTISGTRPDRIAKSAIVTNGDLVLEDVTVAFTNHTAGNFGAGGIIVNGGDLTVDGATIEYVKSGYNSDYNPIVVNAKGIVGKGDIVFTNNANVYVHYQDACIAVTADGDIRIDNSTVKIIPKEFSYSAQKLFNKTPTLSFVNDAYDVAANDWFAPYVNGVLTAPYNEPFDLELFDTYRYFTIEPHTKHTFEYMVEVQVEGDCQTTYKYLMACSHPKCSETTVLEGGLGEHNWVDGTCSVCQKAYELGDTPFYITNVGTGGYSNITMQPVIWAYQVNGQWQYGPTWEFDLKALASRLKIAMDQMPAGTRYINIPAQRQIFNAYAENIVFFNNAAVTVNQALLREFLAEYTRIGGKLDGITVDFEYVMADSWRLYERYAGKLDGQEAPDEKVYANIFADSRYTEIVRPLLVERGFKFYEGDGQCELYCLHPSAGDQYAMSRGIWNQVVQELHNELVDQAMAPLFEFYPDAVMSDFEQVDQKSWVSDSNVNLPRQGNNSNYFVYFDRLRGTTTVAGYLGGEFAQTPFNATLYDTNKFKQIYAAASGEKGISVWITDYLSNSEANGGYAGTAAGTPYYSEMIYHLALTNTTEFYGYFAKEEVGEEMLPVVMDVANQLMVELTRVAGASDRTPIELPVNWNSKFILSGMYAGGRNIWRITPDTELLSKESFKVEGDVPTFTIAGQTVTFPQGTIIEDATISEVGTCGYWVETPADVMPVITSEADRYSGLYETAAELKVYDVETGYIVDAEVARTEATAYRVNYVNADTVNKIVKVYNNGELIEEILVAPGTDGYTYGIVEETSNLLTVEIVNACEHIEVKYESVDGENHNVLCAECDELIRTEAHSYDDASDLTCDTCGYERVDKALKFNTINMSFQDSICLQLIAKSSDLPGYDMQSFYVEYSQEVYNNTTGQIEIVSGILEKIANTTKQQVFTHPVRSVAMAERVTVTIYGMKDGVLYKSEPIVTSIMQRAMEKFDGYIEAGDEARCKIYANLLNYGATVQKRYKHNIDNLPTAEFTDVHKAYLSKELPAPTGLTNSQTNDGTLNPVKVAVSMQDRIIIELPFLTKNMANPGDYELRYSVNNGAEQTIDGSTFATDSSSHICRIALKANEMSNVFEMSLYNKATGERVSNIYTYSLAAAAEEKYTAGISEGSSGELNLALANYGNAVSAVYPPNA